MIILFIFMIITLKINIKVFYTLSTIKFKKLFFIIAKTIQKSMTHNKAYSTREIIFKN